MKRDGARKPKRKLLGKKERSAIAKLAAAKRLRNMGLKPRKRPKSSNEVSMGFQQILSDLEGQQAHLDEQISDTEALLHQLEGEKRKLGLAMELLVGKKTKNGHNTVVARTKLAIKRAARRSGGGGGAALAVTEEGGKPKRYKLRARHLTTCQNPDCARSFRSKRMGTKFCSKRCNDHAQRSKKLKDREMRGPAPAHRADMIYHKVCKNPHCGRAFKSYGAPAQRYCTTECLRAVRDQRAINEGQVVHEANGKRAKGTTLLPGDTLSTQEKTQAHA